MLIVEIQQSNRVAELMVDESTVLPSWSSNEGGRQTTNNYNCEIFKILEGQMYGRQMVSYGVEFPKGTELNS